MITTYPLLIDGGLSNELERQGCNLNDKLWSAKLLITQPEAIVEAHLAYLKAGAKGIITASYQATIEGFMALGYTKEAAKQLILKSVELAEVAREQFLKTFPDADRPFIAASVGPYGAYLGDGSEYRGNYGVTSEALQRFHQERLQLLDASNADCLACETIPSFREAKVLGRLLYQTQKPTWLTFSCKDGHHISDGTPIEECIAHLADHPNIFAMGVNCTSPQYISSLVNHIKTAIGDKRIIIYPNSGEQYHVSRKTWSGVFEQIAFQDMVKKWLALGVHIVGGCCRINPAMINEMRKIMK